MLMNFSHNVVSPTSTTMKDPRRWQSRWLHAPVAVAVAAQSTAAVRLYKCDPPVAGDGGLGSFSCSPVIGFQMMIPKEL
jgi:hypothetical protein